MPTRTRRELSPRKKPRQERAQATVEALLQAATYILTRRGWSALTTNAIAERAGVNIASLYQYFPNKEAIVAELRRRHLERIESCASCTLTEGRPETLRQLLESSVKDSIQALRASPELYRVFAEEIPRGRGSKLGTSRVPRAHTWDAGQERMFRGIPDPELAGFIARTATNAVLHEASLTRPELLENPLFVEELLTLLERYLSREDGAAPKPPRRRGSAGRARR